MEIVKERPLNQYENENMDIILYNVINYLSSSAHPNATDIIGNCCLKISLQLNAISMCSF